MNIISSIESYLSLINSDMSSWKVRMHSTNGGGISIRAHNQIEYLGRPVGFNITFNINKVTCDISFKRLVFSQHDVKSNRTRKKLTNELNKAMNDVKKYHLGPPPLSLKTGNTISKEYLLGQRVIYNKVICTICKPENNAHLDSVSENIWIDNPEKGHRHHVSLSNIKPLPNGQL